MKGREGREGEEEVKGERGGVRKRKEGKNKRRKEQMWYQS